MSASFANASIARAGRLPIKGHALLDWITPLFTGAGLATIFAGYCTLCKLLRYRGINQLKKRMGFTDRASLRHMTGDQAQEIVKYIITREFPTMYELGLQFALFKTYGVESISNLLVATKQLADETNSSKRYEDTTIIFSEFQLSPPTSDRALRAIARMNYLHAPYKAAGRISNEDFLYTLAVSAVEPARFIRLYDWRPLTDMELCALGTLWKSVGDAMDIRYDGHLARAGRWADGIEWLEDAARWAAAYEKDALRPAPANAQASRELVRLMNWHVPGPCKPFAKEALAVLMGDRVREAFSIEEPRAWPAAIVYAAITLRQLVLRHLALPRIAPLRVFSDEDPDTGRIKHFYYLVHPWYNPSTFWTRWGPAALARRLVGGYVPGPEGLMPEGFLWSEIGPEKQVGKGEEAMDEDVRRMREMGRAGCPFSRQ